MSNEQQCEGKAIASMVLGIAGLILCFIPIILVLPISILGFIFGIEGMKSNNRGMAIAGVVMCTIGFVIGVIVEFPWLIDFFK